MLVRDHWGRAATVHWDSEYRPRCTRHCAATRPRRAPTSTSPVSRSSPHEDREAGPEGSGRGRAARRALGLLGVVFALLAVVVTRGREPSRPPASAGRARGPVRLVHEPAGGGRGERGRSAASSTRRARTCRPRSPPARRRPRARPRRSSTSGAGPASPGRLRPRFLVRQLHPGAGRAHRGHRGRVRRAGPARDPGLGLGGHHRRARAAYDPHKYDVLSGLEGTIREGLGDGIAKVLFPLLAACVGGWLVVTADRRAPREQARRARRLVLLGVSVVLVGVWTITLGPRRRRADHQGRHLGQRHDQRHPAGQRPRPGDR